MNCKVKEINLLHYNPINWIKDSLLLSPNDWFILIQYLNEKVMHIYKDKIKIRIFSGYSKRGSKGTKFCPIKKQTNEKIFIQTDGNVYPCPLLSNKGIALGNLCSTTLKEIIKKINIYQIKQSFTCKCKYYKECMGGCIAFTNNKSDYRCSLYKNELISRKWLPSCPFVAVELPILGGS